MFYASGDLEAVENQIHGFEAALNAMRDSRECPSFNSEFNLFITEVTGLSTSRGWSRALLKKFGKTPEAEAEFLRLLTAFIAQLANS